MPRKGKHPASFAYDDYDDGYDDYYDDADDSEWTSHEQVGLADSSQIEDPQQRMLSSARQQQPASHSAELATPQNDNLWRCSVCTFDNPEELQSCDICGVLRHRPMPAQTLAGAESSSGDMYSAFKFDAPSPDDLVTAGRRTIIKSTPVKAGASTGTKVNELLESKDEVGMPSTAKFPTKKQVAQGHVQDTLESDQNGTIELSKGLKQVDLNQDSKHQGQLFTGKGPPLDLYKPEGWMLELFKQTSKQLLHLAVVGHVDAGKSTLMGRLLHILGRVSQKEMHKYEKEAKEKGKGSFSYAWVLDESAEERARGVTMTVAVAHFETPKFRVILLDSPGHKDFVPNMISGASQADTAGLVVDASSGAFEAGMNGEGQGGGQTREHTQLVRSFGVEQIIVAVNKMDAVDYSEDRFNAIKAALCPFLRQCGFKGSAIKWVPLSAMENQNLVTHPSEVRLNTWCSGPSLLEAIDTCEPPLRNISKPFRMPIAEIAKSRTLGQAAISGKIEGGAIKTGSKVLVMPAGKMATVNRIELDGNPCTCARAGESVDVALQGVEASFLLQGGVLCHPDYPVPPTSCLELRVLVLETSSPLLRGSQVVLYCHHVKEPAKITQLVALVDQKSGAILKRRPRCLLANQSAIIEVVPERSVCVEEYSRYKALGRVSLRDGGKTVAVGIVVRVFDSE